MKDILSSQSYVKWLSAATILISSVNVNVYAAAFGLTEQNASGLGNAYAGRSAIAEDVSTSFYNPAGLTEFNHHQVVGALTLADANLDVKMRRATRAFSGAVITTGDPSDNAGRLVPIPAAHIGGPLAKKWSYGVSLTAPFGLKTQYDKDSQMRYFGTLSDLKVMDLNPNLAYKLDNRWSLGAGVSVQYAEATLSRQFDNTPFPVVDGKARNKADGVGYGYNFGVLFKPSVSTRLGVAFRSKVKQSVEGHLKAEGIAPFFVARNVMNQKAKAVITLPEVLSISAFQNLNQEWGVIGDVTFTNWHRFKKLVIKYPDTALASTVVEEKFVNSFKVAVGANYKYNQHLTWKFGTAYDRSPVESKHRNFRVPDSDRYWLAVGAKYQFNRNAAVDLGYSHIFMPSSNIRETPIANPPLNRAMSDARVKSSIDLLGVQLTYSF
ncbi:MAG: outer membrane protein transport protein [Gammaproteobacteria bacterium]|nr:outer membrane protein transport protein [Gammaproteobacteria bacterium]